MSQAYQRMPAVRRTPVVLVIILASYFMTPPCAAAAD